jgi:dCTP deaminase
MSVLAKQEIINCVKSGHIKIDPFKESKVGPASIDFHLGKTFRIFEKVNGSFVVDKNVDFHKVTKKITVKKSINLLPGESIHGITVESLTLPPDICGWIQGRSSLARVGLLVHITANFIHPGTQGQQVLEMTNAGPMSLEIQVGIPICQIIFEETKGEACYNGRFHQQNSP